MENNNPIYTYSKDLVTQISDQNVQMAGKVYGVVVECMEALQQIFGLSQIPLNPIEMRFEALTESEEGDVVLTCDWSLSQELVRLGVIRVSDNTVLGTAQLRFGSNNFTENYGRFKDGDLKAKTRTWFDKLSQTDIGTVEPVGSFYQNNAEENTAPAQDIPTVEPEIVSEG